MKRLFIIFIAGSLSLSAQNMITDKDADFIRKAGIGGMLEVRLGHLARTNGASPEVKQLGEQMVLDHSKWNDELKVLASRKNVTLPADLDEKAQKTYNDLSAKQGEEFDKAYTKCMVKDHKKDVCLFKKEAKKGQDQELRAWASQTLPKLEHHKEMAKQTCKKVKEKK
jgi:putative membrane protein